jgi:hypothetical protein
MVKYAIIPEPAYILNNNDNFQCSGISLPTLAENYNNIQKEFQIFNARIINTWGKKACTGNSGKINLITAEGFFDIEFFQLEILPNEIRLCLTVTVL